jgi:ATP-dependent Clp protease ATP-binding subunit ClpB
VLDDGRLTDSQGRTVDFKNSVVIMTSNIGSQHIQAAAGAGEAEYEAMRRQLMDTLRLQLRPEFLNRIDEVIVFHALTEADLAAIVDLLVADLQRRLAGQDISLELTPRARALIAREGHDPAFGARPLKRTIQRHVENPLARALLKGEFRPGDRVTADADPVGGTLVFSADSRTVVADTGDRRDARAGSSTREPAGAGAGGRGGSWDLPDLDDRPKRDGGDLVN